MTKDESIFGVDGWCDEGKPDGDIGQAHDFAKALEPGELSYAYIAGHDGASSTQEPMIIGGPSSALRWITGMSEKPTVIYKGPIVFLTVGGAAKLVSIDLDGTIRMSKNGKMLDIFCTEYGFDPSRIRRPAPSKNGQAKGS